MEDNTHLPREITNSAKRRKADSSTSTDDLTTTKIKPLEQRLDVFLHSTLSKSYPELLRFCQSLLLLSHGQATVERGFSINEEVETCNLLEESVEAQRLICDQFSVCGGVLKVPLTKELLASAASASPQYRIHLELQRKKRESATQGLKRKGAEGPNRCVRHPAKRRGSTSRAGRGKIWIVNGPTDHKVQHPQEETQRKTQ
ncbi:hypothetical protein SKAU_G00237380 [Synaphobranchus kaupii]|uniref:HAT C-terminal dimerisation domain-containing protein n=1 Tax=Synaphobranchus kaupii TaxID=118154 RepID=A0A9Q1F6T2_SYNKA|nr:hypothetical protein SKAU_G00237380 [Synaphobranchus kaupii]